MLPPIAYLLALTAIPGLGPKRIRELLTAYESNPQAAYEALQERRIKKFLPFLDNAPILQKTEQELRQDLESILATGCEVTGIHEDAYPQLLKEAPDAPALLFYRGRLPQTQPLITVVGTRAMTLYGSQVVQTLLTPLAAQGVGIISGLAFGVDAESHRTALQAGGYTAAVLGSGPDVITPARHDYLAHEIITSGGAIISELAPGTRAMDGSFPRRNRILAALSPITLVIEAAEKSGALITANYAIGYHRDVAAVPGSIFTTASKGCHRLLRDRARLITSAEDLIEMLSLEILPQEKTPPPTLTKTQQQIYSLLSSQAKSVDVLAMEFEGHSAELFGVLTELELLGIVKQHPGASYTRC